MKLRTKILLYILAVAVLALSSTYILSNTIFLDRFAKLDREAVESRMSDIVNTYHTELQGINETMLNYSVWDETYDFVRERTAPDPENPYIQSNFDEATFESNRFDLMALTNRRGDLVYSGMYNQRRQKTVPATPEVTELLSSIRQRLAVFTEASDRFVGLVMLEKGPMLIACQPIVRNDRSGPVAGMAVAGRMLDREEIGRIGRLSPSGITVESATGERLAGSGGQNIWVEKLSGHFLAGHGVIYDLFGNPGIILSMEQERHIYLSGQNAMSNFTLFFVISTTGICLLSLLFINRTILNRMAALVRSIRVIRQSGDLTVRIGLTGRDEFGEVEKEFNRLVSSLESTHQELHSKAMLDPLTRLPNRAYFFQTLDRAIRQAAGSGRQIALLFIDLDHFKAINDTWGHDFGDAILKQIADRLSGAVGPEDLVSRLGGDEFTILLAHLSDPVDIQARIFPIQRVLSEPYLLNGQVFHSTASIGVSVYPQNGESAELLVKAADLAMFQVKENGRNNVFRYSSQLDERVSRKKVLGRQLLSAAENGELEMHYQPILSASTGEVVKVEALLRWTSPTFGPVSPAEFIPLAEASGSMLGIGTWVIERVCTDLRRFRENGVELTAAVNISGLQLMHPGLPGELARALKANGLQPGCLELEITETVLMSGESVFGALEELRSLGFRISLDDFGTGFSSLSYLRHFTVDLIKIDRSFVSGIRPGATDDTLVRTVIELGHNLGLRVISEGVELKEQFELLCHLGTDELQGYYISRPLPAAKLEEFIFNRQYDLFLSK
ncbi:bifunctional diguanylate cyclase/phosphodiesterase [Paenibacillus glufosinatiresistens]|uniref:bifunctional diguanylate cyclase/phosphodiesterase n=1 Tax=Paenibacillus glufosinatiresistens TaxID=3070657 RepID=UPI00286E981B|nr:EAL domain-containing protein [Paenibacillus sp. YX.27]